MAEQIRFYADQHFPFPITRGLRRRGIDVLTAQDAGTCGDPDNEQLDFASRQDRVLLSFDSDFLTLHNSGVSHAGIASCPATKYGIAQLVQLLTLTHAIVTADEM